MSEYSLRQCNLQKGNRTQVVWIPQKFAVKGSVLRLISEDGWELMSVSKELFTNSFLNERSRDYVNTRKASDI